MGIHLFSLEADLAPILEKTLAFIGAIYDFKRAVLAYVTVDLTFLNIQAALILARNDSFGAFIRYMLFHLIKSEVLSALE